MSKLLEQLNTNKKEMTLGDVVTFHRGYDLPLTEIKPGPYPVVFSNGRRENHAEFKVKGPGVFTGRSGSLGGMFYVEDDYWPHNTTLYVSDFHGNDPRYCYYFLSSFDFAKYNAGTGVPTLNRNHIHGIPVEIPAVPTQKKIASILSAYDAKIENNNTIIKNLEATAQTIFNEWFVNFHFPGYEKVKMVDSEMGEIPEGWNIGNIEAICSRLPSGKVFKEIELSLKGNVPVYDQSSKGIIGFHNEEPAFNVDVDNPILIFGDHTCRIQLVCEPFSLGPNTIPLSGKNGYNPIFSYFLIKDLIEQREYKRHWNELVSYKMVIPPSEIAGNFSGKTKVFIEKIVTCEKENISLKSQRNSLLLKLI